MSKSKRKEINTKDKDKFRRRPAGNKFLIEYYKLFDEILEILTEEEYIYEEEREDYFTIWRKTNKRILYNIFNVLGKGIITNENMVRINNIVNNKMKIVHNQILAYNFILILDELVRNAVSTSPFSQEKILKGYPWSIMIKKDYDYFEMDMSNTDVKIVAKKYCRLSKILGRLPRIYEFEAVTKFKRGIIYKIMKDENFMNFATDIFKSWYKLKKNTNKETKKKAEKLNSDFTNLFKSGYITNYDETDYKKEKLIEGKRIKKNVNNNEELLFDSDNPNYSENNFNGEELNNSEIDEEKNLNSETEEENDSYTPFDGKSLDDEEKNKLKEIIIKKKDEMEYLKEEIEILENKLNNNL